MSIVFVNMRSEHIDDVISLGLATPEFQTGTSVPQFYSKETLSKWIQSPNGTLLVANVSKEFAGFSITAYNPDSRDGYMHCMAVKEQYRNQNVGTEFINKTLDELQKMGCNHVYCLIQTSNERMKKFLEKRGFQIGETFSYVQRTLPRK